MCVPVYMWPVLMQRVCACLYGEISRSNLGRARVNSGTNGRERERETEMNTEVKGAEGGREVWEGGGRKTIRKYRAAVRLVVSL